MKKPSSKNHSENSTGDEPRPNKLQRGNVTPNKRYMPDDFTKTKAKTKGSKKRGSR
jgi:hypothetical protein